MPSRFWSAVLHAAYFSYYLIVRCRPIVFLWRGQTERGPALRLRGDGDLRHLLSRLHLLPGGRAVLRLSPPRPLVHRQRAGAAGVRDARGRQLLRRGVSELARRGRRRGATVAAWRGSRGLGLVLAVPTVLLTVGVVYCQMHYAVDAVAGAMVGAGGRVEAEGEEKGGEDGKTEGRRRRKDGGGETKRTERRVPSFRLPSLRFTGP